VRQKVELIEIAVWLILAGFGLLTAVLASGCANPNADKGWLSRQNHQWNYRYHPLTVKWDRKLFEYQNDSVELAMDMYPCEMLQEHESDDNPDIMLQVSMGQPICNDPLDRADDRYSDHPDGAAQAYAVPCPGWCEIYLRGDTLGLAPELVYVVAAHEFGHCVGLTHDEAMPGFWQSIMYPDPSGVSDALEKGRPLPRLTDADTERLEGRYCPR